MLLLSPLKKTNKYSKQFLLCSLSYPYMFRHPNANFRGLHFLASYSSFLSLRFGWMWAIVRSVWSLSYPYMFRHPNVIFRGLHFLASYSNFLSMRFGWMWAIV